MRRETWRLLRTPRAQVALGTVPMLAYAWAVERNPITAGLVQRYPFFALFPVIVLVSAVGGLVPGGLSAVVGTILLRLHWVDDHRWLDEIVQTSYLGLGFVIAWTYERLYRREAELHQVAGESAAKARDLAVALDKLRESEAARTEFLANLSHELRTPLNVIMGYVRMLRTARSDADRQRMLGVVERNAIAQLRLVEDLLDMQRITSGRFGIERAEFDLAPVALSAIESLRPQLTAKAVRLDSRIEPVRMYGDAARIQQVLWNLLENAIKFTPEGGAIAVLVARRGSDVEIVVRDSGEGVPKHFLPFVFERFRQLDGSVTRRHSGMGLGLSIVKSVVEQHGGSVTAESEGEHTGATFVVRFPLGS